MSEKGLHHHKVETNSCRECRSYSLSWKISTRTKPYLPRYLSSFPSTRSRDRFDATTATATTENHFSTSLFRHAP